MLRSDPMDPRLTHLLVHPLKNCASYFSKRRYILIQNTRWILYIQFDLWLIVKSLPEIWPSQSLPHPLRNRPLIQLALLILSKKSLNQNPTEYSSLWLFMLSLDWSVSILVSISDEYARRNWSWQYPHITKPGWLSHFNAQIRMLFGRSPFPFSIQHHILIIMHNVHRI